MMTLFGSKFRAAMRGFVYEAHNEHGYLLAIGLFIALLVVWFLGQLVFGHAASWLMTGHTLTVQAQQASERALAYQSLVLGLLPCNILVALVACLLARAKGQSAKTALGLTKPALGFLGWIVVLAAFFLSVALFASAAIQFTGENVTQFLPNSDSISDPEFKGGGLEAAIAGLANRPILFFFAFLATAFAAPLAEEFIFRGAIFSALRQSPLGAPGAAVITSALWAVIHAGPAPWIFVAIIFFMGLVLSFILVRFGSLWITVACHALWNAVTSINIFLAAFPGQ